MHAPNLPIIALLGFSTALAFPSPSALESRQSTACFIVGKSALPQEVTDSVIAIQSAVKCNTSKTTISGVPDVTSGSTSFSSIDFSKSSDTPLAFALDKFATAQPLASTNLVTFQDMLNVYLATEAGVRSTGGSLAIKVPKFFLEMQVSRIQTAQGNPPTAAGLQVDHLRDKVTKNAAGESKALLDEVAKLAAQLS